MSWLSHLFTSIYELVLDLLRKESGGLGLSRTIANSVVRDDPVGIEEEVLCMRDQPGWLALVVEMLAG
jgi:hypothetical protein